MKSDKNEARARADRARTASEDGDGQSGLEQYDPEKYGEITSESESCEPALLTEYAIMMGVWTTGVVAFLAVAQANDLLPKKIKPLEFLLLGVATHKLSRLLAKDRITGVVRAPFVHYIKSAGEGEVEEEPRGRGMQRAIGLLVSCPYCLGPWVAAALGFGMIFRPRPTRLLASILGVVALSDFLHRGYALTKEE